MNIIFECKQLIEMYWYLIYQLIEGIRNSIFSSLYPFVHDRNGFNYYGQGNCRVENPFEEISCLELFWISSEYLYGIYEISVYGGRMRI